ncbi:MAG TPA: heme biosynthesis protein HemY, partial [Alphaproteobacteria bacterium]|nr:heme biosynthesis protein HemY [Alphaproteobacteria bacterium]
MLRLIWLFLLIAAIAAGAAWMADHPGAVAIDWLGYRFETSFAVMLLGLALLFLGLVCALSLLRRLRGGIDSLIRRREARRQKQGLRALTEAMTALAAGDTARAQELARRAGNMLGDNRA